MRRAPLQQCATTGCVFYPHALRYKALLGVRNWATVGNTAVADPSSAVRCGAVRGAGRGGGRGTAVADPNSAVRCGVAQGGAVLASTSRSVIVLPRSSFSITASFFKTLIANRFFVFFSSARNTCSCRRRWSPLVAVGRRCAAQAERTKAPHRVSVWAWGVLICPTKPRKRLGVGVLICPTKPSTWLSTAIDLDPSALARCEDDTAGTGQQGSARTAMGMATLK